ncbi:diguanylate cyclase [Colwellia echini]|uniref:diguanylate cyclase n=1 Tax=Colwellia echini TaxID=1982103 RepID=A0ABY3MXF8_9GAMM|nr:diguanylate cyclase [Colwellia echini]TYK65722.1 diguanylate cyclase [Colwellia echini]
MKALVVEPSRTHQLLINEFLNGFSISHDIVTTGEEALKALAQAEVNIIIIAMVLTDTKATILAEKIRAMEQYSDAVIIVMTGEQEEAKLIDMKTPAINYICQRNKLSQFKSILVMLSHYDISAYKVMGHILYIEDHLTVANMTMDIIQQMGLTFEHCNSAEEGLDLFDNNMYDLVLLDIALSGHKNGIDMIKEIRKRDDEKSSTPILSLSATANTSDRISALKVGSNDFIAKPVLQAELAVRVKNLITARQLYLKIVSQQQALEQLAMTDQLTGLYNRHFLNSFIDKALGLAKRHKYQLSILMIDLDKFKFINDTFGHDQGDEVLVKIADVLKNNCRVEDIAVRLGGDEFLVVLPHCSQAQAIIKANELCDKIQNIETVRKTVFAAASFGVSSTEQGSHDYKTLFELADQAVYEAKTSGGNTVNYIEKG